MVFGLLDLALLGIMAATAPAAVPTAATTPAAVPTSIDSGLNRPAGLELNFTAVVQVEEPAKAAENLIRRTESMGGYFSNRTQESLEFRLPMAKADAWIDSLSGIGLVVERNLQTESLEGVWLELISRLKAKRASLNDYYAMLKVSGDSTIFLIQNSITQLQREMEETSHTILKLQDRMQFAHLTINFRFPNRAAPLATGVSRFPWLNRLDLHGLLKHYQYAGE